MDALRDLAGDVRHAIRVLAKTPGFSVTVVAVLTLGIGLNAAVFTLLKSLALTPISGVAGSAGLNVVLNETSGGRQDSLSYPHYQFVRDHDRAFVGLVGTRNIQAYQSSMMLHARGSAGVDALTARVRAEIQRLDPDLPMVEVGTLSEAVRGNLMIMEMAAGGLFVFGVAAMALAGMGIYGLVSYTVRQSTHEIGIRMALGARGSEVVWHFLRRGLRLGTLGAVAGTVAALALTRLLGGVLYGVSATDPSSFAGALAVVLGGVLVATIVPAWRAARTGPLTALRRR